ncbi:MAG: hypothetical protein WCH43_03740 [Verrucomicrobiota bacterium]
MKHYSFKILGAIAMIAFAAGCATDTKSKENLMTAAGFKTIVASSAQQQQHLKSLPAAKISMVQRKGKTYYVFPDVTHNQLFVGSPAQYKTYQQLRLQNKMATEQLESAELYQEATSQLEMWGPWWY